MKTSTFIKLLSFISSALTSVFLVGNLALVLAHIFLPVIILFPFALITIASWVLALSAIDLDVQQTGGKNLF